MKSLLCFALLALSVSAGGYGLFGHSFEMCISEIQFSNSPGPRIGLFGYSGPSQLFNELVVIASNKKHGAQTDIVDISSLGVFFSCGDSPDSTSFSQDNELDHFEVTDENGQDWRYTQQWCGAQQDKWVDWNRYNTHDWAFDFDPARHLCCFAKNWKGPNIHHPDPEVNSKDALKHTGVGGNPWIYIASKYNDVNLKCSHPLRTITLEDGTTHDFCLIGKGKGNAKGNYGDSCVSFHGNLRGHGRGTCDGETEICDNHASSPDPNGAPGNVYIDIGGDGLVVDCNDIDVVLLLSNNEKLTHTVAEDDVVMHDYINLNGHAFFLKSGHHQENNEDFSNRCTTMSKESGYNEDCSEPSCGSARCGFGGDPQIYYKDCTQDPPLQYLSNCNHHSASPRDLDACYTVENWKHFDRPDDSCICQCPGNVESGEGGYPESGESGSGGYHYRRNSTKRGEEVCPGQDPIARYAGQKFGVREALEIHNAGMPTEEGRINSVLGEAQQLVEQAPKPVETAKPVEEVSPVEDAPVEEASPVEEVQPVEENAEEVAHLVFPGDGEKPTISLFDN